MANFYSDLSHRYTFKESSGDILDQIGSNDSDSINGTPFRTGRSYIFDGGNQFASWNPSTWKATGDITGYCAWRSVITPGSIDITVCGAEELTFPAKLREPFLYSNVASAKTFTAKWDDLVLSQAHSRNINANEWIVSLFSFNDTTKLFSWVVKSKGFPSPVDISNTGTSSANPGAQIMILASNQNLFPLDNIEVWEVGSIDGMAKSVSDLQGQADTILDILVPIPSSVNKASRLSVTNRLRL